MFCCVQSVLRWWQIKPGSQSGVGLQWPQTLTEQVLLLFGLRFMNRINQTNINTIRIMHHNILCFKNCEVRIQPGAGHTKGTGQYDT